jgi:NinB protein
MSGRRLFILASDAVRARVKSFIDSAPIGVRVEIKEPKRSTEQNARMWAMLGDVADQAEHFGRKYSDDVWKCIFMHDLGRQCEFVPALSGETVIPLGFRSSDMTVREMRDLIDFMDAWGAEHGVTFHDPRESKAA